MPPPLGNNAKIVYNCAMTKKTTHLGGAWALQVPDFARRIGEAARAKRVVLFGSAARGDMRPHSDLDFLVIVPDTHSQEELEAAWVGARRSLRPFKHPHVDILLATESRVRRLRDCPYGPIKFALDEGVELWHD